MSVLSTMTVDGLSRAAERLLTRHQRGEFDNKVPHPDTEIRPEIPEFLTKPVCDLTPEEMQKLPEALKEVPPEVLALYSSGAAASKAERRRAYREGRFAARRRLQEAMEDEFGISEHPKRERVYELAVRLGRDESDETLIETYRDLVELLID